ncbi:glycosyltransferase family 4 protein [Paucihalobacter ruber]|uniref:Glycosyltransferase family 4 protein n=1 Tax=Paucihalobacter ruber TaxID=2567861 RepID=A0A506PK12_9FLAO|nr:glycosyltransferase family 4 protein [Paucihalobacter ruber]TPV33848.1 glycosyltransferase family 4 protein [Paucihalobacter ruber]
MIKIAIFSGSIPSSTFIENLIKGVAQKHQVQLYGVIEKPIVYEQGNIHIYKTPKSHWGNLWLTIKRILKLALQSPKNLSILLKETKRFKSNYERWIWFTKFLPIVLYKPDILHLQWARDLEFYYFMQSKLGIQLLVSLRGAHINYTPIVEPRMAKIYQETFPNISAFHAVSEAIAHEASCYGADMKRIKVIRSPLSPLFIDSYQPCNKPSHMPLQLIVVGRFHWKKGYSYLLNAMHMLKQQGLSVHLNFIGENDYPEEILFQLHQLGLENQVNLLGKKSQEELATLLKQHHALVLPSLEEGIANVVLEAMALGVPVISTNCGGMAEVVKPGETGWLVPVRDPKALAAAITKLHHTPEYELQRITANAHQLVKQHFNAEDRIAEFLEFYEDVVRSSEN